MTETINHINVGQKYRVVFERSAVKGQDGFKVESNSDSTADVLADSILLYNRAKEITKSQEV